LEWFFEVGKFLGEEMNVLVENFEKNLEEVLWGCRKIRIWRRGKNFVDINVAKQYG